MMDKKIKKLWIEALLSGKYKQGKEYLIIRRNKKKTEYCCLGVLVKVQGGSFNDLGYPVIGENTMHSTGLLNDAMLAGMTDAQQSHLTAMNDSGKTFKQIASYIKNKIKGV
jgi:hypothetical protein